MLNRLKCHIGWHSWVQPEPIEVIEAWNLNFGLGNAVKYISRAGRKSSSDAVTDLRKAAFYLQREIERLSEGTP